MSRWKLTVRDRATGRVYWHGVVPGEPTPGQRAMHEAWVSGRYGLGVETVIEPEPPGEAAWWDAFFADLAAFKADQSAS